MNLLFSSASLPNQTLCLDIIQIGKNCDNFLKGVRDYIYFSFIFQMRTHTVSGGELFPNDTKHINTIPTCSEALTNAFGEQKFKLNLL